MSNALLIYMWLVYDGIAEAKSSTHYFSYDFINKNYFLIVWKHGQSSRCYTLNTQSDIYNITRYLKINGITPNFIENEADTNKNRLLEFKKMSYEQESN